MAGILPGPLVSDIRGKVGEVIFQRNQGGNFVRSTYTWEQPDSDEQKAVRDTLKFLQVAWSDSLTELQRTRWRTYAHRWPLPDRWGNYTLTNGYTYFIRVNFYHYLAFADLEFLDPPNTGPLHIPTFTFTADANTDTVTITLPPTSYTPPPQNLRLWIYVSRPAKASLLTCKLGYRYAGTNIYTGTWQTDPWTTPAPWPFAPGEKIFARLIAQDAARGALSRHHRTDTIAT